MFMMNISFVPSICNHRSTIFIFNKKNFRKKNQTNKTKLNTFPDNNCSKLNIPHFSHCVSVCVSVLIEREGERERGGEERELYPLTFPRPAYPKIHLSVLQTVCVRIFRFMIGLFSLFCLVLLFFADVPPIRQDKKVSKGNFSIIYLSRTVCELTFSMKQPHYKTGTLWHSDASILFTSANVVLDERHSDAFILVTLCLLKSRLLVQKSFWIKDRTKFLQKQCTVCAVFVDGDMSFLERLMSGRSLFPWSLPFFLLFLGSVQSFATDRFVYKPAICEDG